VLINTNSRINWLKFVAVQLFHDFCHFSDINFVTRSSSSEARDFSAVTERERPFFAAELAFLFPGIPTWLGIQHKVMVFPCFVWTEYSLINFCTRSLSVLKPWIACRLDSKSEKITNFSNFDKQMISIARNIAYSSARKMLVRSGSHTQYVVLLYTTAEATQSPL